MSPANLIWEDDKTLLINDVRFFLSWDTKQLREVKSSENLFLLGKDRAMIERSAAMAQREKINKVFDMGVLQGGSVVLYDQIFQPDKIVAIERERLQVDALSSYIATRNKLDVLKPYFGVNQADRSAMESILEKEFPERDIDLIVDDASHLYRETKDAFNISFPYLRPGGQYIIEDWAWAHWPGKPWQTRPWHFWKRRPFRGRRALSNLLIELFMLAASRMDFIEEIWINHNVIVVKKGRGQLPEGKFNIEDHYLLRGKRFSAPL